MMISSVPAKCVAPRLIWFGAHLPGYIADSSVKGTFRESNGIPIVNNLGGRSKFSIGLEY